MLIYTILIFYYLMTIPLNKYFHSKNERIFWLFFLLFPLFIMVAFRSLNVGSDTLTYFRMYNNSSGIGLTQPYVGYTEIGFQFINRLFNVFGFSFMLYQICYAFFVYLSIYIFLFKYSKNFSLSIFIFIALRVFFFSMTGVRQMIAISIILYSLPYLINRKLLKFLIITTIAALIHNTAIVFIFIYFIPYKVFSKKTIVKLFFIMGITLLIFDNLIELFLILYPKYSTYLARIESYDGLFVYVQFILVIMIFFFGYFVSEKYNLRHSKENKIYFNAALFSVLLALLATQINIAGRYLKYFYMIYLIYLPAIFINNKRSKYKLINSVFLFLLLVYYLIILVYRPNWEGVLPYEFMFSF